MIIPCQPAGELGLGNVVTQPESTPGQEIASEQFSLSGSQPAVSVVVVKQSYLKPLIMKRLLSVGCCAV